MLSSRPTPRRRCCPAPDRTCGTRLAARRSSGRRSTAPSALSRSWAPGSLSLAVLPSARHKKRVVANLSLTPLCSAAPLTANRSCADAGRLYIPPKYMSCKRASTGSLSCLRFGGNMRVKNCAIGGVLVDVESCPPDMFSTRLHMKTHSLSLSSIHFCLTFSSSRLFLMLHTLYSRR